MVAHLHEHNVRKVIAKKQRDKLPKEKARFTMKALEQGMSQADIDELWQQMEDFASYSLT